jgi:hypothetical protein
VFGNANEGDTAELDGHCPSSLFGEDVAEDENENLLVFISSPQREKARG